MCSIGIQVSVTTISASSWTAVTPFGATPKVAITMRCAPATASHRVRQVFDDELVARAGRSELLHLADEQHKPTRARGAESDLTHGAHVAMRQLRLALGREHFRDVEHVRERGALGRLAVGGLQEVPADHEPVMRSDQRLNPASSQR